jgi:hypothetical protein
MLDRITSIEPINHFRELTMPIVRNDVTFLTFEEARDPNNSANKAVAQVNLGDVIFPFGFFIKEKDGKKVVVPATLEHKMKVLRTAFPEKDLAGFQTASCTDTDSLGNCGHGCDKSQGFLCMKVNHFEFYGCACVSAE